MTKRKRLVREEEDDRAWFQKRKRKSAKQEDADHVLPTAPTELGVDETRQEPPTEKKPAKQKLTKRVLVPRSRKKPPVKPPPEPQKHEPILLPEPQVEALPPAKKRTKTKTPAVVKRKPKQSDTLDALPPIHEHQDGLGHDSSQTITKPALPNKAQTVHHPHDKKADNKHVEKTLDLKPRHHLAATPEQLDPPPKKKKVVRRVRVPKASTKRAMSLDDNQAAIAADTDIPKESPPTDDVHVDLFEAVAPSPNTKKASKAPKRIFFNDDSDVDLDQMLSGIAAMAGAKTATKAATSKSSRATRKKAAS